ncbi:hypothetical protein [Halosimplex pelagicum]|uniref:Uncharacterized protein n=1 Tax=Halosimplex pelagicum TaxID=869886 RepID=A0A7D5PBD4_9EURY|nr:hypothetical protein [Halosimplex pelagicum]QLH82182.1 hypothetical protein HZS54_11445 [Halosimplex pelagicum]
MNILTNRGDKIPRNHKEKAVVELTLETRGTKAIKELNDRKNNEPKHIQFKRMSHSRPPMSENGTELKNHGVIEA